MFPFHRLQLRECFAECAGEATFADAPAEARRLIRRRQRGADVAVLDRGLYGYLVSRVALRHPNGGEWTMSRALGETQQALDALELHTHKDFGQLVRERRRQRGLSLPIADKVLPFRPPTQAVENAVSSTEEQVNGASSSEVHVVEAWNQLAAAERDKRSPRMLRTLEANYMEAVRAVESGARTSTTPPYDKSNCS